MKLLCLSLPSPRYYASIAATAALFITGSFGSDEAPLYQSHFEDNLHQLTDWRAGESPEAFELTVRRLDPQERPAGHVEEASAALVLRCHEAQTPLRIAQVAELFRLQAGQNYLLRVTLRVPELELKGKERVVLLVTDARWRWSSPPLLITAQHHEWQTLDLPFTAPDSAEGHFRVRLEALPTALHLEIAKITIAPTDPIQ